jgi:hypothetical protein
MNTPFKTKGIYIRKVDADKELSNYKPTKLGSIWKAAIGEKEGSFYRFLLFSKVYKSPFSENYKSSKDYDEEKEYCVEYSNAHIVEEILEFVDRQKKTYSSNPTYKNVVFENNKFEFGDERAAFYGFIYDDILQLRISLKEKGGLICEEYRYIPWI